MLAKETTSIHVFDTINKQPHETKNPLASCRWHTLLLRTFGTLSYNDARRFCSSPHPKFTGPPHAKNHKKTRKRNMWYISRGLRPLTAMNRPRTGQGTYPTCTRPQESFASIALATHYYSSRLESWATLNAFECCRPLPATRAFLTVAPVPRQSSGLKARHRQRILETNDPPDIFDFSETSPTWVPELQQWRAL